MKILYLTNGMSSTLNSSFELSRRLLGAGHDVTYASQADVGDRVEAQGYTFIRLDGDRRFVAAAEEVGLTWRDLARPPVFERKVRARKAIRRDSIENDEIERVVGSLDPDLLIVDMEMHFALIALAHLGLPTLLAIVWFTLFRHRGLPPMHTELLPTDARSVEWAWRRLRISTVVGETRRRLAQIARCELFRPVEYATYRIEDLRELARARDYDLAARTDRRQWLRPYLYRDLPILVFNLFEMEFPHEPHPQNVYVGPMVFRGRAEAQMSRAERARWRRFRDARDRSRSLVYCSLGSFWLVDESFLENVLRVFERRTEWDLVLGLGGKLPHDALAPVPPNALVLDFAPQLEVLEIADCAVTHGGITTINECVQSGVPMVVYSTKRVDQNGCAARVAFHGLGVVSDKDVDGADEIENHIERALRDPEIRRNVETMREQVAAYERLNAVVKVVENAAAGRSRA